ncbi:MAG: hypothetical protein ABI591_04815 [Kofleriaceae bacterium]
MTLVATAKKLLGQPKPDPHDAHYTCRELDAEAPGAHVELISQLLVKSVSLTPPINWPRVWDIADHAWSWLGERVGPVWDAYENIEADDILRLEWYGKIAKQGKAFARPWLERGRARKLEPRRTNGKISKKIYEAKLDRLLGNAPKVVASRVTPSDPKQGYCFEAYVAAVLKASLVAAKTLELPVPITRIHLAGLDDDITVHFLAFEGSGDSVVARLPKLATRIPKTGDHADPVLRAFNKRHGLVGDPSAPSWGNAYEPPTAILIEELLAVVEAVGKTVKRARGCELCVGDGDNTWQRSDKFGAGAKRRMKRLEPAVRDDLLRLCFETPAKRAAYS